jgi:hypothetical protein
MTSTLEPGTLALKIRVAGHLILRSPEDVRRIVGRVNWKS